MEIACIVCVDENWGIGSNNKLLTHIPEDMKFFKEITENNLVIMGRKTYDSLPNKPLPNRCNCVITSKIKEGNIMELNNNGTIFATMDSMKASLSNIDQNWFPFNIYIIGGGAIYKELLPYCEHAYVTKVFHSYDNVDTFFPNIDNMKEWQLMNTSKIKEYNNIKYQFYIYNRSDINGQDSNA